MTNLRKSFRTAILTGIAALGFAAGASAQTQPKPTQLVFNDSTIAGVPKEYSIWQERQKVALTNMDMNETYFDWLENLDALWLQDSSILTKANYINTLVDASLIYNSDKNIYNHREYFAPPAQSLTVGFGDCEDYAIAKYDALLYVGVPESRMKLLVVGHNKMKMRFDHCVLAVDTSAANDWTNPLILSNHTLPMRIAPAGRGNFVPAIPVASPIVTFNQTKYKPFFAIDAAGVRTFKNKKVSGLKP